jgi:membrane-bound lytic murein transglycosylase D
MPLTMGRIIGLCEYYMPIFQETFDRYGLPEELKAMAVIESAMNPLAVSRVGAKGMWQFMYQTAKLYGLHIDSFVDERLDPVKSADAAARYLKDAYSIFGDWNLAIASYNCGAGNVNKAIKRSGSRKFWDLWPFLPRETRGYGPAFVGALYTLNYYKEHGIKPEKMQMPPHVDTFHINKMLHLKQVSELTGAPLDILKALNPQYKHEIIPGNEREYILRIPYNYTNSFIACEDSLYRHKADVYFNPTTIKKIKDGGDGERIVYKVKNGDYLGRIASKYRVSVAQIKRWNNLKSNNIRVGQRLVIYRGGKAPASVSSSSSAAKPSTAKSSTAQQSTSKPVVSSSGNYVIYTVKSGDSFYSIAKNYPGVSAQNIMDYNGIEGSKIRPGMKIKIPLNK